MSLMGHERSIRVPRRAEPALVDLGIRENMTLAEEKALLGRFAKAAGAGEMLNIHDLKAALRRRSGTRQVTAPSITFSTATIGTS
jgi:hypothetical protein